MFPAEPGPERVGSYAIVRRLGGSGAVDIYLALGEQDDDRPRLCELKLVQRVAGDARAITGELTREAAILGQLRHPAIVKMIDLFEDDQRIALVLEYVEGASLEQLLEARAQRGERLGDAAIAYIGREVASALAHAHEAADEAGNLTPVVHRNLHPGNVLVSLDGQARLTGFALGKILGRTPDTTAGVVKGTPGYMAPEQVRGDRVTPRTDVYGLGILLWSMLTGRRSPLGGPAVGSLAELRPDLPPEVVTAVAQALEPDDARRKVTCTEIEQWLETTMDVDAGREALRQEIRAFRQSLVAPGGAPVDVTPTPGGGHVLLRSMLPVTAPVVKIVDAPEHLSLITPSPFAIAPGESGAPGAPASSRPPLSAVESIAVATITGALVIAAGVFIAQRDLQVPTRAALPPGASVTAAPAALAVPVPPRRTVPLTASATRPGATPSPALARTRPPPDAASLPPTMGYLTVSTPGAATVYVNGAAVGEVNQPIKLPCGRRFVRIGTAVDAGAATTWLAAGRTVDVPCKGFVQTDMKPDAKPPTGVLSR